MIDKVVDKHCELVLKNGKRCSAYKITGSKHCFTHTQDPEIVKMREKALQKASESKKLYFPIGPGEVSLNFPKFVDLSKAKGIKKAYITIIKAAAQDTMDIRKLGALTFALNGYVNAIGKVELFEKVEALERALKVREAGRGLIEDRINRLTELITSAKREEQLSSEERQSFMDNARFLSKQDGIKTEEEFKIWLKIWVARAKREK